MVPLWGLTRILWILGLYLLLGGVWRVVLGDWWDGCGLKCAFTCW